MRNWTGGRYWNDSKTWNLVKENPRGCNRNLENITMTIKLFVLMKWNLCFEFTKKDYTNNIYFSVFLGRFVLRVLLTLNIKEFYKKNDFYVGLQYSYVNKLLSFSRILCSIQNFWIFRYFAKPNHAKFTRILNHS